MPDRDDPAVLEPFERVRPRLQAIAYRMLGSVQDAEDLVQETFLRWYQADRSAVEDPGRWLRTVCVRLSIDATRAAYRKRETYVGPWLPEPVLGDPGPDTAELAESLGTAFLLLLERLSPTERAAFLLHDVFGYGYEDLANTLGKSESACRQVVSRARKRVADRKPRFTAARARAEELLERFLAATRSGDLESLKTLLTEDAELWSDGGGKVPSALNVLHGPERIGRFLIGLTAKFGHLVVAEPAIVNGGPGVVFLADDAIDSVTGVDLSADGRVDRVYIVRNPEKLRYLSATLAGPE